MEHFVRVPGKIILQCTVQKSYNSDFSLCFSKTQQYLQNNISTKTAYVTRNFYVQGRWQANVTCLCMALSPLMHCYPFVGGEIFAICDIPLGFPSGT